VGELVSLISTYGWPVILVAALVHRKGPRAKIDEVPRTHLFLSEKRYQYLRRWHGRKRNRHRIPKVRPYERRRTEGKKHIEFACKAKRLSHWHRSAGIVKISKNPKLLIRAALKKVCGRTEIHRKRALR
jgi:hypothetical protein